jgi:hypothetical protein
LIPALASPREPAERVTFLSRDRKTTLLDYLFKPAPRAAGGCPRS